jgi:hypothetical protein
MMPLVTTALKRSFPQLVTPFLESGAGYNDIFAGRGRICAGLCFTKTRDSRPRGNFNRFPKPIWLDGLDIPSVRLMEPMFFEEHPETYEKIVSVGAASPNRFSPDSIQAQLDEVRGDPKEAHGPRIALAAPDMPNMGLTVERLSAGHHARS